MNRVENKLDKVLQASSSEPLESISLLTTESQELLSSLPVNSVDEFFNLEKKLQIDKDLHSSLENHLNIPGCSTLRSLVFNMLKKIFVDSTAEEFSLTGKSLLEKPKQKFVNTKCFHLVLKICTRKFGTEADMPGIRCAISDWFNQSKSRRQRRKPL
ncbi:hypothetical protein WDU94_006457 [Cyamophila willieti]